MNKFIENTIEKILINLHQNIQTIKQDLEEIDAKSKIYKFKDGVEILSQHYKGSFNYEIPRQSDKLNDDNQFYDSFQQIFQSSTNNNQYTQVIYILQQNQKLKSQRKQIYLTFKERKINQIPQCLNIKHNKHEKEIIMFNLESNETQTCRLACVDCIHYIDPIKYTLLQDANLKWDEFNKLNNESQQIQLQYFYQINYTDIYEFNQEQIDELTLILSKQDKFKAQCDQQFNIEKEDQIRYNLIINNLISLLEFELLKRENILKNSKYDQSIPNTIKLRIQTKE